LRAYKHKARSFHGHELAGAALGVGSHVVWEWDTFRLVPERWPASDVDVDTLRVLAVTQEWLQMFPAIQAADLAECRGDYTGEGLRLAITSDQPFHVGWLDLAAVEDYRAGWVDE
jgi:hypothetical protein